MQDPGLLSLCVEMIVQELVLGNLESKGNLEPEKAAESLKLMR